MFIYILHAHGNRKNSGPKFPTAQIIDFGIWTSPQEIQIQIQIQNILVTQVKPATRIAQWVHLTNHTGHLGADHVNFRKNLPY